MSINLHILQVCCKVASPPNRGERFGFNAKEVTMGDGSDPTTTIPATIGHDHVVLIIILGLIGILTTSIGIRLFIRSLWTKRQGSKALGGITSAVAALSLSLLAFTAGNGVVGALLLLMMMGFLAYTVPQVRAGVRQLFTGAHGTKPHAH